MNIAEKLVKLRKEKGFTQEKLCELLDISISSIRNYENIKKPREPQNDILLKFADFYNVSTEYLLNDEITNKTNENINIGNELQISDEAIKAIKEISTYHLSNILNTFLENKFITRIMMILHKIESLYIIQKNYICLFCSLFDFYEFFINSFENTNKVDIKNSIDILTLYKCKVKEAITFIDNCYYLDKDLFFNIYELENILNKILLSFNNNDEDNILNNITNTIYDNLSLFSELSTQMFKNTLIHINYNKFEFNEFINDFISNIAPPIYGHCEIYQPELENYYKYSSSSNQKENLDYIKNNINSSSNNDLINFIKKELIKDE